MSVSIDPQLWESPYVYGFANIHAIRDGSSVGFADGHWHLMVKRYQGKTEVTLDGPLTKLYVDHHREGAEYIGIRFKLGTFMPHLPVSMMVDDRIVLPDASSKTFWLNGASWEIPTPDNVDVFIDRLVREDVIVREPVVDAMLQGQASDLSPRSVQRRFLQATGLTHKTLQQIQRAQRAVALLQQGVSILDTVYDAGYFDQPHLTRAIKRWTGQTPTQIITLREFQ